MKSIQWTMATAMLFIAIVPGARAQCENQDAKVELLTRQVAALQKEILTLKKAGTTPEQPPRKAAADATRQRVAAAKGAGKAEALALYDRIDQLLAEEQVEQAKQALVDFNAEYEGTPAAAWTKSLTRELTAVGKPAPPDWSIDRWFQGESDVDLDGEEPTVVVFWESWCPHCRHEVPKMQAIYDEYRKQGLQVVGVTRLTRDSTEEKVSEFIHDHSVSYPIAKEDGSLAEYFSVKGIPAAAVVKNGRIIWRGHPTRLKKELLESWL